MRHHPTVLAVTTLLGAAILLAGCDPRPAPAAPVNKASTHTTDPEASGTTTLLNGVSMNREHAELALSAFPVAAAASMTGYTQKSFPHWRSAIKYGWEIQQKSCDAREATLIRDGINVTTDASCKITGGSWTDPYTGQQTANPTDLDIDHIVPRAAAWRAGANQWDEEQRTIYANAPLVLVAADDSTNSAKGDKGPEAWKPPRHEAWCGYGIRWIATKNEYGLALTSEAERSALHELLNTCQD